MIYKTLDNGGNPFSVEINSNLRTVSVNTLNCKSKYNQDWRYKKLFIGKGSYNTTDEDFVGNAILFKVKSENNTYVYICERVIVFDLQEPICHFVSTVGNSGVPYSYAVTESEYIFFQCSFTVYEHKLMYHQIIKSVPHKFIQNPTDPYKDFYFNKKIQISDIPIVTLHSGFNQ